MRFKSVRAGQIDAMMWWKVTNSGTRVGGIYDMATNLLATCTFSGETAHGWQTQALSSPLAIAANTDYCTVVYDDTGYYGFIGACYPRGDANLFSNPLYAYEMRYNGGGPLSFPGNTNVPAGFGMTDVVFTDTGPIPTVEVNSGAKSSVVGWLKKIHLGGMTGPHDSVHGSPLLAGVSRYNLDGSPAAPCLLMRQPGYWRFRWGVEAGNRTISIRVKQVANVEPFPSLVLKANPAVGIDADIVEVSDGGAGWVTITSSFLCIAAGVIWVELRNNCTSIYSPANANLTGNPAEPAFWDHLVTS